MKIIVFGATGSIGIPFIQKALENGYEVTAFARRPEKIGFEHTSLSKIAGDANDHEAVIQAIKGHDTAVIAIGSGKSPISRIRSIATENVISGMKQHGVKRLICQTTLGTHDSWDILNFYWKRIMFGFILRSVFEDHQIQETMVVNSGLDWTVVRPSAFTDEPATGTYKIDFKEKSEDLSFKIPRTDVADFLYKQLTDNTFLRKRVNISN